MTTDQIREIVKYRMQALSITEYRLAKMTGISRSFLGRWLKGEYRITLDKFLLICSALEINIDLKVDVIGAGEPQLHKANTILPAVFSSVEEAVILLKLDRRHKWEEFCGELVYPHKYSHACSGCTETKEMQSTPERGEGCHECGYTGKRINVVPVPAFMPDGSIVKVVPQNGR